MASIYCIYLFDKRRYKLWKPSVAQPQQETSSNSSQLEFGLLAAGVGGLAPCSRPAAF